MINYLYRIAYVWAYRIMRIIWAVSRPHTNGALVAIWHQNTILLIRNSYLRYYNLPGGYIRRNESARKAALRELREEVGISTGMEMLKPALDMTHKWESRQDHVEIFAIELDHRPEMKVDNREVVSASFYTPLEALKLKLFPPLRKHIEERLSTKL